MQLLALLLVALTITHLVAAALLLHDRNTTQVHPLAVNEMLARTAAVYQLVSRRPGEASDLLADLSVPESVFELSDELLDAGGMVGQERTLAARLRARLGLPADVPVVVRLRTVASLLEEGEALNLANVDHEGWFLETRIGMQDAMGGMYLRNWQLPAMMRNHLGWFLNYSIPVSLLPAVLIAILLGRRIMRPLKALTNAARHVSRGGGVTHIRPEGPSDIREVIEAFNDMQERLVRYVGDKTKMIAAIGHDLRTPLTSLRIRAELIDDNELRTAMIHTLNEMSVMAEEALSFAQDDLVEEPIQEVDLGRLVEDVSSHRRLTGQQVACNVPAEIRYRCRPVHLKRALGNLIDNAGRYGKVVTHLRALPDEQVIVIDVEDDGPGIPADMLEQVFEPFVRLDADRNMEMGGSGLGLAIARSCIRAHGGDIVLENRPEGGLRARVTLPL
ncbi:ATP-binding protein [Pseudomonas sp. S 311-6]|nr:ATP-binding protein [Pseudomonas sp. S 311-6]